MQTVLEPLSDKDLAQLCGEAAHMLRRAEAEITTLRAALNLVHAEIVNAVEAFARGDGATVWSALHEAEAIPRHHAGAVSTGGLPPNVVRIDDLRRRRIAADLGRL